MIVESIQKRRNGIAKDFTVATMAILN